MELSGTAGSASTGAGAMIEGWYYQLDQRQSRAMQLHMNGKMLSPVRCFKIERAVYGRTEWREKAGGERMGGA